MSLIKDYVGREIRLTEERWRHIQEHPEMSDMRSAVEETLRAPEVVVQSLSDSEVRLYYRYYPNTMVSGKYLCGGGEGSGRRRLCGDSLPHRPREERRRLMAKKTVKMWFDPEADFLEVIFDQKPGYFRATENDQVMEKVDEQGNVIGFSVLRVSFLKKAPLEVSLS